jgi:hypothetical protein
MGDHAPGGTVAGRCLDLPRPGQAKAPHRRSGLMIPTHVPNSGDRGVKSPADVLREDHRRKPDKTPRNTAIVRNSLV